VEGTCVGLYLGRTDIPPSTVLPSPRVSFILSPPSSPTSPSSDKHQSERPGKKKEKNQKKSAAIPFAPLGCLTGLELRGADAGATEGLWNKQSAASRGAQGPCICTVTEVRGHVPLRPGCRYLAVAPLMRLSGRRSLQSAACQIFTEAKPGTRCQNACLCWRG
jgi:hypothetical protein